MDSAAFQQVRAMPLFSELNDTQLGCIEPGEIIHVPSGTVLVSEGERSPFFFMILEGEIRLTRNYDRQTVLMGIIKPGHYTGEITLLLDVAWMATARTGKPTKLFRLGQEDFWHMMGTCRSVAQTIFNSAREQGAKPGRLFSATGKTCLSGHHGGGIGARTQ
ncbi:MAG: cyclic nucleotide-binding domain-containing protein [Limisphaerales bacterium]